MKKHLLSIDDVTTDDIATIFATATEMHDVQNREVKKLPALRGRTVINLFFEDSTRTRSSFEIAGKWLSADTINITGKGSSTSKGESLRDTVMTVAAMGVDALVIRHHASGSALQVSQWVDASVVNAGDGTHEHPSQALLDAYTLQRRFGSGGRLGSLQDRHVVIVGDLTHSRVFRSNVLCLTKLGARVTVVAPPTLMPSGVGAWSAQDGFETTYDLDEVLPRADAVMMLRVQRERMNGGFFPTAREYTVGYGLTRERLATLGPDVPICHPGPMNRGLEIAADAADAAQSAVLEQVSAGVAIRMAILYHLLAGEEDPMTAPTDRILIRGARLLGERAADLLVEDGVIVSTSTTETSGTTAGARVIDADGMIALPGLVDLHTHLREPGREDAETVLTGSRAAAVGGFTAVLAMANTQPVTDTAEAAERVLDLGRTAGLVDVQPVGAVTKGLAGDELAELGLMARSRARVRVFSDDGRCVGNARVMRRALEYVRAFGGVVSQHSQDPDLAGPASCCHEGELSGRLGLPGWPGVAEEVIVARDVMLARHTGSRVHVAHASTAGTVEVLRWARAQAKKDRHWAVTAEVTPHHLLLTTDLVAGYDPTFKVNPPLRPAEDVEALRAGLADGTIDAVATDHAPHARHDKEHAFVDAAFGMVGLETALSVVAQVMVEPGRMSWADLARVMSTTPARIAGLDAHGGTLDVGRPATLTLVDPAASVTVDRDASVSLSRNNPWHGRSFEAAVRATLLRGVPTVLDGKLV